VPIHSSQSGNGHRRGTGTIRPKLIGKTDADIWSGTKAFIVLKNGYPAEEDLLEKLKTHVKEKAGPWKFPRWIELRDALPRTATGKVQRFKLRDEDLQAG